MRLSRLQIQVIARQEGADEAVTQEALRRMATNPHVARGELRSPGAFFRGVVRGVIADQTAAHASPPDDRDTQPLPPKPVPIAATVPSGTVPTSDRTFGHLYLDAVRLLREGVTLNTLPDRLAHEHPNAPPPYVAQAVQSAILIHRTLLHR